jgi:hypothetical protein
MQYRNIQEMGSRPLIDCEVCSLLYLNIDVERKGHDGYQPGTDWSSSKLLKSDIIRYISHLEPDFILMCIIIGIHIFSANTLYHCSNTLVFNTQQLEVSAGALLVITTESGVSTSTVIICGLGLSG